MTQTLESQAQTSVSVNPWELLTTTRPDHAGSNQFRHVLALFNPVTIDEQILAIHTLTPFYADVHHELVHEMAVRGLVGDTVRAILESPCGF
jgi:hypothetical protein